MSAILSSNAAAPADLPELPRPPARAWLVGSAEPTAALARFAAALAIESLTAEEIHAAKRHLLDSIGSCIAGIDQPLVRGARALLAATTGSGDRPVVGSTMRTNLLSAVYLMAASCHALELDDGNREGSIHPGTVVVPALLGMGHELDVDGAALLCAMTAGYEVAVSLAEVLHPHAGKRGFQTTGVVGAAGAAAAVGRLIGIDADRMEKAIGIAASSGAGLFAYLSGGGNIKKLHPAHAAREGVFAALLARDGVIEGPLSVAESPAGIFHAFGGVHPWEGRRPAPRDGALAITRSYVKPYPCCRHVHPAVDGLLEMRAQYRIDPDAVERIEIGTYQAAMPHASVGWESLTSAQLSFPYIMAAALRTGTIELASFADSTRNDPRVIADIAKVRIAADPQCCAAYPREGPARVAVTMKDGTVHSRYVANPRGCPEVPMSDAALFDKFRMMAAGRLNASDAERAIEAVWTLENAGSVRPLIDLLCAS